MTRATGNAEQADTLEPSLIKTDEQYRRALEAVERLAAEDPPADSPAGARLELWAKLVEDYEKTRYPFAQPDPVDAILFRMAQQGLRQKDLAEMLGGKNRASEVLARKRPLTLPMIRAVSAALEIPPALLIREPAAPYAVSGARAGSAAGTGDAVVAAWLARVRERAAAQTAVQARFRAGSLDEDLIRYVSRLSWMDRGPRLAIEFLDERGIAVVIEPLLRGEQAARIDAAALRGRGGAPAIALTLRQDRLDHFWSALITALVLAWKHLGDDGDGEIIAVDIEARRGDSGGRDAGSHGARDLAAEILIPRAVWQRSAAATDPTAETIRALAAQMQISPAIVAGRVRDEREDFTLFPELVGQRRVRALFPEMRGAARPGSSRKTR
jgi:HTH-type transcriptional regulator/antitoxin HigA